MKQQSVLSGRGSSRLSHCRACAKMRVLADASVAHAATEAVANMARSSVAADDRVLNFPFVRCEMLPA